MHSGFLTLVLKKKKSIKCNSGDVEAVKQTDIWKNKLPSSGVKKYQNGENSPGNKHSWKLTHNVRGAWGAGCEGLLCACACPLHTDGNYRKPPSGGTHRARPHAPSSFTCQTQELCWACRGWQLSYDAGQRAGLQGISGYSIKCNQSGRYCLRYLCIYW